MTFEQQKNPKERRLGATAFPFLVVNVFHS